MLSMPMKSSAFIILYLTHKLMSIMINAHDDRSSSLFIMIFLYSEDVFSFHEGNEWQYSHDNFNNTA